MEKLKLKIHTLLRKSERIFKTDMVYLVKGGSWLTLGQVIATLSAFITALFFANAVSKDVYGNYKFILAAAGILGAFSLTGMAQVVAQGVAQGSEGIFKDAVKTSLRWGSIVVVIALGVSVYYFLNGNAPFGYAFLIAGITNPFIDAFGLYGAYLGGKKDFKRSTLYNTGSQLFTTVVVIITAVTTQNALAIVAAYFISSTLGILWSYRSVLSRFKPNTVGDKTLIPYSKHLSVIYLLGTIASQSDRIFVFHFLGPVSLAIYSFAQAIPEQIKGVFKNLFGVALPKYAVLPDAELRKSVIKKSLQLTGMTVIIVLLYILAAPLVFGLIFPKYIESVFYSQIYMLGLIFVPAISLFSIYFQIKMASRIMYKINIMSGIFTLILTFVLVYKYGLMGVAVENGLSWLILFLINVYYFRKIKSAS
ncbi:MAG TPA: oligosaccharide flippase family protein [Candidatus Paceibacterota bacterium]|nr:oligosaccharide flippase family protein [Candidatus Paceibacterota bacterium]